MLYLVLIPLLLAVFVHIVLFPFSLPSLSSSQSLSLSQSESVRGACVLVTGASLGIGRSLAEEFARAGAAQIVIASRSEQRLQLVKQQILQAMEADPLTPSPSAVQVHVVPADLSSQENCEKLIAEAARLMGSIDFLVLNHITDSHYGLWFDDALGHYDKQDKAFLFDIFRVNAFSYMWLATAAMEELIKSGGRIAVVSSLAGHVGTPFTAAYSATKHALQGFFDSLRNELRILGVDTVSITICAIGATDTEGASGAKARLPNVAWDPPNEAALAIIKGASARKRNIYHPHFKVFPVVLLNSFFPDLVDYILRTFM